MALHVTVERTDDGFIARNDRGGVIRFGGGTDPGFSPVEMLLAALGGCNLVTVEPLTAKRGHRMARLSAHVTAEKVKPNQLGTVTMAYDVTPPEGDPDAERILREVAERAHRLICPVSTALETVTPVELRFEG